ncbi:MAG: M48 family metallopeptidase [Dehalococcoidia bacterium]|nr:M48 family metallopeptidase [Dehalococcoidia bacterium]
MNVFFSVILVALGADFLLNLVANILNLKALKLEIPPDLEGIYKPEEYRKSQEYTRTTTRFGLLTSTFNLVLLLCFWFIGGFDWLDQVVREWGFISLVNGLLYIGILSLAHGLLTLPFGIYATFVIEERFGFNRTTPRIFGTDMLKGLFLALLLGAPVLAGILALFQYLGDFAWIYCWIAVTLFGLALQFVAPTWIMPLFNKFTPMEPGELKEGILNYAQSVDFKVENVFVMDGSRRSSKSNAFFTGFGKNKRIALFDTLIANHTSPELVAVLAHEIGHYKKKHILQGIVISIVHTGILFFLLSILLNSSGLYRAFGMEQESIYTGLLFFGLLYTPVEMLLSIFLQMLYRKNEYSADRFAAETIDEPHRLTDALKKLSASNLSNLSPHPFYVFLYYSHPPLLQRIQAIGQSEIEGRRPKHNR